LLALLLLCLASTAAAAAGPENEREDERLWHLTVDGERLVVLYFFWSEHCPHCHEARPFVEALERRHDWLHVRDLEVSDDPENARLYVALARRVGEAARSVPAFVFCGEMITGFDGPAGVGGYLEERLESCRRGGAATAEPASPVVPVPLLGPVDPSAWSLPALAVTLGALDSFNPCAFFVLLFLLTLLVHARSRARMLLVGGLFVLVSGLVYFLFLSAWLNLFLVVGRLPWITLAAGVLAIVIGLVNVKDYLALRRGPTLSIPESAKPGLFARMRRLVAAERLTTLIPGTLALAVVANTYELLCTAGFPMVFTRVLTLHELGSAAYYGLLALYCAVYVVPLLIIVTVFVISLGGRRLTEREGRTLKLLSGVMMLGLGVVLVTAPALLANVLVAVALLVVAVLVTLAARRWAPV
jgi:thiol-disulfide isomerase/thioredoxin